MESIFAEVYIDVEKAIDFAFNGKFVLKFYDYLKDRNTKKIDVEKFIQSSTVTEIYSIISELDEYIEGGGDNPHKQLREAYGHIPKPQARKIRNYLNNIIEDAWRYNNDKRPGRKKKSK